jgi:glycosyltransferase involved in cell wall biosynthesis
MCTAWAARCLATAGDVLRAITVRYANHTYAAFDRIYALNEPVRSQLAEWGIHHVDLLSLGADTERFSPARRDPDYRRKLGLPGDGPLLIYAGRLDNEKRADRLVEMFHRLPREMGAAMVMLGDGKLREALTRGPRACPSPCPALWTTAMRWRWRWPPAIFMCRPWRMKLSASR